MEWIKMKKWIPVWEDGMRYVPIANEGAIIWLFRAHYQLESGLSWDTGFDSGH